MLSPEVKLELEAAIATKHTLTFYLDNRGDQRIERIDERQNDETTDSLVERLVTATEGRSPTFAVCYVLRGNLQQNGKDVLLKNVPALIDDAENNRVRFYMEREEMYGEPAWPQGS